MTLFFKNKNGELEVIIDVWFEFIYMNYYANEIMRNLF